MIDFKNIEQYKENNRIEAKKALGGLPHSIWETYSAFANALGGIILLGVEEYKDKSFHLVDLPDPEAMIREFWEIVKHTNKVSANILAERDVTVEQIDGKRIVAIRVPRAQRSDKPVYIDGNPFTGSYRRNGEGDYRCTKEEVEAMLRDATVKTQDMTLLEHLAPSVLNDNTIGRYRARMIDCRPDHVWAKLDGTELLTKLGALGRSSDGTLHPTVAGLLMFGHEPEIVKEFPDYRLIYRENGIELVASSYGEENGNVFDFYSRVYDKMTQKIPDNLPVRQAIGEALANCLVNADYYGEHGILICQTKDEITFSNPGGFRIDVETAKSGGVSDPRNATLIKMFHLIDVGKRTGSGIPNMFRVWKKQGWSAPVIDESFDPDRITLSLPLGEANGQKESENEPKRAIKTVAYREAIVAYLTEKISATAPELSSLIGISEAKASAVLNQMIEDHILVSEGEGEEIFYRLKA